MPRRPKVWFDFAYLTSLDAESAPREVFFLSEPAQQALSQLAEIVLWPTRWFNGDPDDSAVLAASIYEELKVPAHFDDLIPLLDDVETLLQELIDKELCCDTIDSVPGGDGIGGVDESTLPPDVDRDGESLPPEYEGDPEAYDAYLCGQAEAIADSTDDAVDAVHDTILAASNVIVFATLVVLAFGNVIGMGIAAILAGGYTLVTISEIVGYYSAFTELRELLGGGDPGGLVAQTKGELSSIHDDIVDAIYCANDAAEATANLHSLVNATVTSGAYAALLRLTYTIAMRPIFWGFGGAADSTGCDCIVDPDEVWDWGFNNPPTGFSLVTANQGNDYIETLADNGGMYKYLTPPIGDGTMRVTVRASFLTSTLNTCTWRIEARDGSDPNGAVLDYEEQVEPGDLSINDYDVTLDISARSGSMVTVRMRKVSSTSPSYYLRWIEGALYW